MLKTDHYNIAGTDPDVTATPETHNPCTGRSLLGLHPPGDLSDPLAIAFGQSDLSSSMSQFADFVSLSIDPELLSNLDWSSPDTQELFPGSVDPLSLQMACQDVFNTFPAVSTAMSDEGGKDSKQTTKPRKTAKPPKTANRERRSRNKRTSLHVSDQHSETKVELNRPRLRTASRCKKNRTGSKESTKTGSKGARIRHNDVEKNYRTKLGTHFQRLLDALPTSTIETERRSPGADASDSPRPVDVSRIEVLQMAWNRIKVLEKENDALVAKDQDYKDVLGRMYEMN